MVRLRVLLQLLLWVLGAMPLLNNCWANTITQCNAINQQQRELFSQALNSR